ncbi:MAG: hypothetical protein ACRBFS_02270 [Aureispira sp.]
MAKLSIPLLSIFLLFLFQSCEKEVIEAAATSQATPTTASLSKITVQNNVLAFETIHDYLAFVDHEDYSMTDKVVEHAKTLPFESYGQQQKKEMDFESDFIEAILNKDRIVKIGKWFIKINPKTEQVYALSDAFKEHYSILVSNKPAHKHIHQFSTDDDVIALLQDEANINAKGLFCGESGAANHPFDQTRYLAFVPADSYPASRYEFPCKITYLKLGIYYTLKAYMKVEKETRSPHGANATISTHAYPNLPIRIFSQRRYKVRCGTEHGWYTKVTPVTDNKVTYKSYQGSKRLHKYQLRIGFEAAYPGSGGYTNVWNYLLWYPYQREIKHGY